MQLPALTGGAANAGATSGAYGASSAAGAWTVNLGTKAQAGYLGLPQWLWIAMAVGGAWYVLRRKGGN